MLDDPSQFNGVKLDAVINRILFITNSIGYVDPDGNFIVKGRRHSRRIIHSFYKNSIDGYKDNIYGITNINNGRQRLKNSWFWGGTSIYSTSLEHHSKRYGISRRSISEPSVTNTDTIQNILDYQRDEWQFPKQEMQIETDYLPGVFSFYDTVTLDINPRYSRQNDLAISGLAVSGEARSVDFLSGFKIDPLKGFKILAISHDLNQGKTILKLRNIGKTLTDGYLEMILSQTYSVVFTAATSVDIDVSPDGLNAQYCKVEILDSGSDYKTDMIEVKRPDANTIRLTSGVAITKTFRVLVVEAQA